VCQRLFDDQLTIDSDQDFSCFAFQSRLVRERRILVESFHSSTKSIGNHFHTGRIHLIHAQMELITQPFITADAATRVKVRPSNRRPYIPV
jgi:hypothetical protein